MIPSYPNPTSGAPTENPRNQAAVTGLTGSQRRAVRQAAGSEEGSSFSQLLNGEMALTRSGKSESEDMPQRDMSAKEIPTSHQEIQRPGTGPGSESTGSIESGLDTTLTSPGDPLAVNPGLLETGMLAGALTSWGDLANMIQSSEPWAMANLPVGGISRTEGSTPVMVAGLATDIASGYAEKDGVQTLKVNLEPEHLGRVEVQLQAKGDHLSVRLLAANPEAESAMRENIKDLTDAIQVRTGRFHQVEIKVELKESHEPDNDPPEKEKRDYNGQGSPDEQRSDPETEMESGGNRHDQVATEPDPRAQGG